jgi:hypothetical protein
MEHPITPPPFELINQWHKEACKDPYNGGRFIESKVLKYITTAAAQWGADQELEACCEWAKQFNYDDECYEDKLRAARRPKPPSLKEQALEQLDEISTCFRVSHGGPIVCDKIRKALEALPND